MIGARGILLAALAALPAAAEKAHVHGQASLNVAIEGGRLTLEFESPLADLVGFERQPANDIERATLAALEGYLRSGEAFVPAAAAACRLATAAVHIGTPASGHAEVRATVRYECANISALKAIDAAILRKHPRLRRIDAQVAGTRKQSAARLTPAKPGLQL